MNKPRPQTTAQLACIPRNDLPRLLEALQGKGYQVIGPTRRDGAIVYDQLASVDDLPHGWTDQQEGGAYRLLKRSDGALFGYALGPHSWKRFLHPPRTRLWQTQRDSRSFQAQAEAPAAPRRAFLGVRACELQALAILDKVFLGGSVVDPEYSRRREQLFMVAVHCTQPGGTCFCASLGTGPRAAGGFDLAMTELLQPRHCFLVEAGTEKGRELLAELPRETASEAEAQSAREQVRLAGERMGRSLEPAGLKELLYRNSEHPRWEQVAGRCLTCANCTMVCPTCFCTTILDETSLTGETAERWRLWDSCFNLNFSYIHGGSVRYSPKARYRQWLTHKLATWQDQYGTIGCVGCGRCITWCPVAIDLTEEVRAIRQSDGVAPRKETKDEDT